MGRTGRGLVLTGFFCLLAAAAHAVPPDVPVYRSFKDWEVGCDNTRRCSAIGLQPEDHAEVTAFVTIERTAGGRAAPSVRAVLAKEGLAPGDPVTLAIDGAPIEGVTSRRSVDAIETERAYPTIRLAANEVTPFVEALRSGRRLQLATDDGQAAEVSLEGAVAALLFIDEVQGRLDTVSALIRRGPQPATAVPAAAALPVVQPRPAPAGATVAPGLAAAVGQRLPAGDERDCNLKEAEVFPLGEGRALVGVPCGGGAYNFAIDYFVVEAGDPARARPAAFPQPGDEAAGQAATNTLFGSYVDAPSARISFFSRGRGVGDCGSRGIYAWTGEEFAVVSYAAMHACRGVPDDFWPILWRSTMAAAR
jgi:Protein of unknown function (DUF1176)